MWTPEDRALVGDFGSGQALSDDQFRLLEPFIPPGQAGRSAADDGHAAHDGRSVLCRAAPACQWRHAAARPTLIIVRRIESTTGFVVLPAQVGR